MEFRDSQLSLETLLEELQSIHKAVLAAETAHQESIKKVHENYTYSALNFIRYLTVRTFDLRTIQENLAAFGLSSLSHIERQVLANIENVIYLISICKGTKFQGKFDFASHPVNYIESNKSLRKNTNRLFGNHIRDRGIMVTLSTLALEKEHTKLLLQKGMNIARINCSHDNKEVWAQYISNLKECAASLGIACSIFMDISGPKIRIKNIEWYFSVNKPKAPKLFKGDKLLLCREFPNRKSIKGNNIKAAFTLTIPDCIPQIKVGSHLYIDDGKIRCKVLSFLKDDVVVEVDKTAIKGSKLKLEKGVNMPGLNYQFETLTQKDYEDLAFVVKEADILGFSFVKNSDDVHLLQEVLKTYNREDIGLVLKIENQMAFENLPEILLQAMKFPNIGVMTARGDLAIELGIERLSEVQEEIMWLCEAAFVPNIWATQVFESLAKKGALSRAEVTDAAMSSRAECVMLNKGPYIDEALSTLLNILERMDNHQHKKQGKLRKLAVADKFLQTFR